MADISTFSLAAETALSVLEHLCANQIQKAAIWGSPSGKALMASRIVKEIPAHKVYVEPFAGGGAVLFKKEPSQTEIVNDLDPEIAFAFRFIKNITQEQIQALKRKKWVGDKAVFRRLRKSPIPSNPVDRFYRFAYLTRFAFNNLRDTATMSNDGVGKECGLMGRIERNAPRLKNITVRSTDYEKVIKEFDSADTFFFLDPPYAGYDALPNAGKYHKDWDEKRFFNVVKQIKGKFLCTYGIRGDKTLLKGFYVRKWRHLSGVGGRESHTSQTFIISNYNPNTANRAHSLKVGHR